MTGDTVAELVVGPELVIYLQPRLLPPAYSICEKCVVCSHEFVNSKLSFADAPCALHRCSELNHLWMFSAHARPLWGRGGQHTTATIHPAAKQAGGRSPDGTGI